MRTRILPSTAIALSLPALAAQAQSDIPEQAVVYGTVRQPIPARPGVRTAL